MDPCQQNLLITLLSNYLASRLTTDELAQAAALLTQLGDSLDFLATQQTLCQAQGGGKPLSPVLPEDASHPEV